VSPTSGVSTYSYDGLGRTLTVTDPSGQVTVTGYDDAHGRTSVTLANGLVSASAYDAAGRLVSVSRSNASSQDLGQTRYYYDADNRLRMTQDATGVRTFVLYDEDGRRVGDIAADGSLVETVYNAAGQPVSVIRYATTVNVSALVDANGAPASVPLSSIRPTGTQYGTWQIYDSAGRLAKTVDEQGYVTEIRYDGASRVTDRIRYANPVNAAAITSATLPGDAAVQPVADAADRHTRYFYDGDGRQLATLDAEGYLTENV
jgi:YD repeat-containing protein